jgi:protein tyrosine phosphatase
MCKFYEVALIIMLTDIIEEGKEKCLKYWDIKGLSNFEIGKKSETTAISKDVFFRQLKLRSLKNKEYIGTDIDQIQFIGWNDHEGITYEYFEKY